MKVGDLVIIKGSVLVLDSSGSLGAGQGDVGIVITMRARVSGIAIRTETTVAWNGERGTGRYWSRDLEVIA